MVGNNPKLHLVNVDVHTNLVRFCRLVLKVLIGNEILTLIKGHYSVKILRKTRIVRGPDYSPASELFSRLRKTMMGNNPKLDLVNVDVHKKIGKILSICSQDNKQKQYSDVNQGPLLRQNFAKNDGQQYQARFCQC